MCNNYMLDNAHRYIITFNFVSYTSITFYVKYVRSGDFYIKYGFTFIFKDIIIIICIIWILKRIHRFFLHHFGHIMAVVLAFQLSWITNYQIDDFIPYELWLSYERQNINTRNARVHISNLSCTCSWRTFYLFLSKYKFQFCYAVQETTNH